MLAGCGRNDSGKGEGAKGAADGPAASDASLKNELFLTDDCDTFSLADLISKVSVDRKMPSPDWFVNGGKDSSMKIDGEFDFFYDKFYDVEMVRFQDLPTDPAEEGACRCCLKSTELEKEKATIPGPKIHLDDASDGGKTFFQSFAFNGKNFAVNDCVYFMPTAFKFDARRATASKPAPAKDISHDPKTYPEACRKTAYVKGSNEACPDPLRIARIVAIYSKGGSLGDQKASPLKLRIAKFYRPENTHRGAAAAYESNFNLVYWSNEETVVEAADIVDKCHVKFVQDPDNFDVDEFLLRTDDAFYFTSVYNAETEEVEPMSRLPVGIGRGASVNGGGQKGGKGGKGGKGKGKSSAPTSVSEDGNSTTNQESPFCYAASILQPLTPASGPLKCLDIFSGCGGLSEGLHQAGVAESLWAIEKVESAAKAFKKNNPDCSVFAEDCNLLLKLAMEGETRYKGQSLPLKGQVELLCGGPPCQGFSGMNRFNHREYSAFKNSLVVTYLSYCDYYRPKFFILENVRNFVSFKGGMVLKLALRCLVSMGYQCTFGVLQAGSYGVAQTRRRLILLAAAPGEVRPCVMHC